MDSVRIVVGVDGSDCSRQALRWALDEAERREAVVDVVHSWTHPATYASPYGITAFIDSSDIITGAEQLLDDVISTEVSARPTVVVNPLATEGSAALVLVDAAKGADLLVVGSRGRGSFAGMLLRSVSQQCAHHASCPVVIVRE